FRWILEEIHVTWAQLEKKQTRLRLYTNSHEEYAYSVWRRLHKLLRRRQDVQEMASGFLKNAFERRHLKRNPRRFNRVTASGKLAYFPMYTPAI
ncbi:hypothetical protein Tco_0550905, partial [Tanacetum coccineum]